MSKTSAKARLECLKAYLFDLNGKKNYFTKSKPKKPSVVYNPNIKPW